MKVFADFPILGCCDWCGRAGMLVLVITFEGHKWCCADKGCGDEWACDCTERSLALTRWLFMEHRGLSPYVTLREA